MENFWTCPEQLLLNFFILQFHFFNPLFRLEALLLAEQAAALDREARLTVRTSAKSWGSLQLLQPPMGLQVGAEYIVLIH